MSSDTPAEVFNPYEHTGGSALALAGEDFVVIAADTRLGSGVTLYSRNQNKLIDLTANAVVASSNCLCDSLALVDVLRHRADEYKYEHHREISVESLAQTLSIIMYNKRFIPFNVYNLLGGIDKDGKGAVYSFDSVGHFQRHTVMSIGSAGHLISPVLDNLVEPYVKQNSDGFSKRLKIPIKVAEDIAIIAFKAATERDIFTGDSLSIKIIKANNIRHYKVPLSKD